MEYWASSNKNGNLKRAGNVMLFAKHSLFVSVGFAVAVALALLDLQLFCQ